MSAISRTLAVVGVLSLIVIAVSLAVVAGWLVLNGGDLIQAIEHAARALEGVPAR